MKRFTWTVLLGLLFLTYYFSSIPGLQVLPVFRQVNGFLGRFDLSITALAGRIAARLPEQFGPFRSAASGIYHYALNNPETMEYLLRKGGHVLLFFVLTVAFFLLLRQYLRHPLGALCGAVILASLLAFLDEFHQLFIPGRSGSIADIFIDLFGVAAAALAIVFALLITASRRAGPAG